MHTPMMSFSVALTSCLSYERSYVEAEVRRVLVASGLIGGAGAAFKYGSHILIKPNLLRANPLSCTHAEVVRAVCMCLQEEGVTVQVADSPGFGSAAGVAEQIGLAAALKPLGLFVRELDTPQAVPLQCGGSWGVARLALESDAILSLPKVKAHAQLRLTLAIKNLFGCVCGLRKAVAHTVQGRSLDIFTRSILDLWQALPPVSALADGIESMHVTGPSGGQPFLLHCLGASRNAMALDTAIYSMLQVHPNSIPLWRAAYDRQFPESMTEQLVFPLQQPEMYAVQGFVLPDTLMDVSFQPHRLCVSLCKRILERWRI